MTDGQNFFHFGPSDNRRKASNRRDVVAKSPAETPAESKIPPPEQVTKTPEASVIKQQANFDFESSGNDAGFVQWRAGRKMAAEELARKLNMPLGHEVEVWLVGGIRLRGKLHLETEVLFVEEESVRHLPLVVDKVSFTYREIESCVRLD